MGVYKRIEDVPDRYQFGQHQAEFEGRDVWGEFIDHLKETWDYSERYYRGTARVEDRWKAHMRDRGRHHALATPMDFEAWCEWLLDEFTIEFAYDPNWIRLEQFYDWLQYHTRFPHVYTPVLMAAENHSAASAIWEKKIEDRANYDWSTKEETDE